MACYGHFETDASFDEGASNGGDASVTCRPEEWGGVLAPEAMFFTEDASGDEHQVWAVSLSGAPLTRLKGFDQGPR